MNRSSQFYANAGLREAEGITEFEAFLSSLRVMRIVARVHHPQTNGKVERLYRTLRDKALFFPFTEWCVKWYNERKPHLSLDFERAETFIEVHMRRFPKKVKACPTTP